MEFTGLLPVLTPGFLFFFFYPPSFLQKLLFLSEIQKNQAGNFELFLIFSQPALLASSGGGGRLEWAFLQTVSEMVRGQLLRLSSNP